MPLRIKIAAVSDKYRRPLSGFGGRARGKNEPYKEFATRSVAGPPLLVPEGQRPEGENVARFSPGDEVWVVGSTPNAKGQPGAYALAVGKSGDITEYPLAHPLYSNFKPDDPKAVFFLLGTEGRVHSAGRNSIIVDMTSERGTSGLWHMLPSDLGSVEQRGQKQLFVPGKIGDPVQVPLHEIADISIGGMDADFYIHRRGPLPVLGMPSEEPLTQGFAVKLLRVPYTSRKDIIQQIAKVWQTGVFRQLAKGSSGKKTLPIAMVEMIPIHINEYGPEPGNIRPGGRRKAEIDMKRSGFIRILAAKARPYQYSTMTDSDFLTHFNEILAESDRRKKHLSNYTSQMQGLRGKPTREVRLGDIASIKTGLSAGEADFWIQRNGTEISVGKPILLPDRGIKDQFGVKLNSNAGISVEDAMAQIHHHWRRGAFVPYARGTLNLKHIGLRDVAQAKLLIKEQ